MIYLLALLLAYGLCFGALQKVAMLPPLIKLRTLGQEIEEREVVEKGEVVATSDSKVKAAVRWLFDGLFTCPYCVGFHCGWMSWLLIREAEGTQLLWTEGHPVLLSVLAWSLISAGFCYVVDMLAMYLEKNAVE